MNDQDMTKNRISIGKEVNNAGIYRKRKTLISEAVNTIFHYLDVMMTDREITVYGNVWCLERYSREVAVARVSKERMKSEIKDLFKLVK